MAVLARNLWSLFKLRISLAIMLCALAGLGVTPGGGLTVSQVAALALAVLLSSASAGAFNHYVERDLDARMARTRSRPFVTGYFRHGPLWLGAILGILALAVALAGLATNWAAASYVFLGAFVYGVVYRSLALVQRPCPQRAAANFKASLLQLSLLLLAAIADPWLQL